VNILQGVWCLPLGMSHPIPQSIIPRVVSTFLFLFYDMFLILVLVSYAYTFFNDFDSRHVCNSNPACQRVKVDILTAGTFSSTVAVILAALHLQASICRLAELRHIPRQDTKIALHDRDIDIRDRSNIDIHDQGTATSGRRGRLSTISEEEYSIGGQSARKRMRTSKKSSKKSRSGSSMVGI
jgi:hypothetical protein